MILSCDISVECNTTRRLGMKTGNNNVVADTRIKAIFIFNTTNWRLLVYWEHFLWNDGIERSTLDLYVWL